ncbi:MAG: septum formation initiator family protein [Clostridiaceae bacterium]|nr:septum formation initiator family protein [Clostridiaceae bacterium]
MAIDWENYGRDRYARSGRQSSAYRTETYVDGNTVRKASALPKRREEEERKRKRAPKRYPQRKPVRMPGISGSSFVFLCGMALVIGLTCFSYLSTQNNVRKIKEEVVTVQTENAELREENEELYQSVADSVDLAEIYEKATSGLGMVKAEDNEVYTYKNKKNDMVKQYADIPGVDD